ncbi:hypothetical protein H4R34_000399 [Dimargaris verticillata]|uniref:HAP1 N-terminal domain-containing protein n=1 Tax=Dimargaris verticillata TaxID=2761393 RepID=A0A9W8EER4_9FUNG|nr:hypothetical protein H4R34_000399 [Dimargaris verticillata]
MRDADDPEALRALLADKERELEMAAQIGLSLAEQNTTLQSRVHQLAQAEANIMDRLRHTDTDRRQFLDKAYQIDDLCMQVQLLRESLQDQQQASQQYERTCQALQQENRWLKEEVKTLTDQFSQIEASYKKASHSSHKALQRLHNLESTLDQERVHISDTSAKLDRLVDRVSTQGTTLGQSLRSLQDHLVLALQAIEILKEEVTELHQCKSETDSDMERDYRSYQSLLDQAQRTIENFLEAHAMLPDGLLGPSLQPLHSLQSDLVPTAAGEQSDSALSLDGLRRLTIANGTGPGFPPASLSQTPLCTTPSTPPTDRAHFGQFLSILSSPRSVPSVASIAEPSSPTQANPKAFDSLFQPPNKVGLRVLRYLSQAPPRTTRSPDPASMGYSSPDPA